MRGTLLKFQDTWLPHGLPRNMSVLSLVFCVLSTAFQVLHAEEEKAAGITCMFISIRGSYVKIYIPFSVSFSTTYQCFDNNKCSRPFALKRISFLHMCPSLCWRQYAPPGCISSDISSLASLHPPPESGLHHIKLEIAMSCLQWEREAQLACTHLHF